MTGIGIQCIDLKSYTEPPVVESEILRYVRFGANVQADDQTLKTMRECLNEVREVAQYNIVYRTAKITKLDADGAMTFDFGDRTLDVVSKDLAGNFTRHNCNMAVFFAGTIGHGMDRLIRRYSAMSPSRALFMQGIGAERIEALCDRFEQEVSESFEVKAPRFSPGFGDLTLELQRDFAAILDFDKKLGIKLGDNLLMTPSKSVTAIIGVHNN